MLLENTQKVSPNNVKSQNVRLLDVLLLAPLMIYSGASKKRPNWLRMTLVGIGIGTALYNYENYKTIDKRTR